MRERSLTSSARLLVTCLLLATACSGGDSLVRPEPMPPAPPGGNPEVSLALLRVGEFIPGQDVFTYGTGFQGRLHTLTVGGTTVTPVVLSDSVARFTVPVFRSCETDGRPVEVAVGDSARQRIIARIQVRDTIALGVGESLVISAEGAGCAQLGSNDQDYVVTALNLSRDAAERPDLLAVVRTHTEAGSAPASSQMLRGVVRSEQLHPSHAFAGLQAGDPYSNAPVPFDPRYATAGPGDTVRFVDWRRSGDCSPAARATAPSYEAVVAAVAGKTVIAVDLRLPNAAEHLAPGSRVLLTRAASIADPLIIPTMREVFDPSFERLGGAGGRHFMLITSYDGVAAASDGGTALPQSRCAPASEMVTMVKGPSVVPSELMARSLASELIHEYAHNAESIIRYRGGFPPAQGAWVGEAWAVAAQETAARIASGQGTRAREDRVSVDAPFSSNGLQSLWGSQPAYSIYAYRGFAPGPGAYSHGASLLMYVRELAGDAPLGTPAKRLFLRLAVARTADPDLLGASVGLAGDTLLDRWALASATDDLLPEAIAISRGLPQLQTWDTRPRLADAVNGWGPRGSRERPSRLIGRTAPSAIDAQASPGSYWAGYVFADEGRGVSLEIRPTAAHSIVRLTRVR